jgi:hypothetical protein
MRTVSREQFQKFILAQVFILIAYVCSTFFITSFLPIELQAYVNASMESDFTVWEIVVIAFSIPYLIWVVHNLRGLYYFKPNAPKHLLYITIISVFYYLNIFEATVFTSLEFLFNDLVFLLTGVTLALVYFSNIADEFSKPLDTTIATQ